MSAYISRKNELWIMYSCHLIHIHSETSHVAIYHVYEYVCMFYVHVVKGLLTLTVSYINDRSTFKHCCIRSSLHLSKSNEIQTLILNDVYIFRGVEEFRPYYSKITKLRVTLNKPVLLLTATCSQKVYDSLCKIFQFDALHHVAVIPNRPNIFLSIEGENSIDMTCAIGWLAHELLEKKQSTPKTLIYVRDLSHIVQIRNMFYHICGDGMYHPEVVRSRTRGFVHKSSMVLPYFAWAGESTKKHIFTDFLLYEDSTARIIICTVAFGLGIDVPDVKRVIHWGAPNNPAAYLQEVGRAGRDNSAAEAYLYVVPAMLRDGKGADTNFQSVLREYCNIKRSKKIVLHSKATQTGDSTGASVDAIVEEHETNELCWRRYLVQQVKLPFMRGTLPPPALCSKKNICARYVCCSVCRKTCECSTAKESTTSLDV